MKIRWGKVIEIMCVEEPKIIFYTAYNGPNQDNMQFKIVIHVPRKKSLLSPSYRRHIYTCITLIFTFCVFIHNCMFRNSIILKFYLWGRMRIVKHKFCWPLYCLSISDLRLLITTFVFSNISSFLITAYAFVNHYYTH